RVSLVSLETPGDRTARPGHCCTSGGTPAEAGETPTLPAPFHTGRLFCGSAKPRLRWSRLLGQSCIRKCWVYVWVIGTHTASSRKSPPSCAPFMNFLVVDDNRLLNRFLTTYLRGKGHVASALTDSSKVSAWLDANQCDAVILDINMPKIDGLSLISTIRQTFADLPIVMFTA